MQCTAKSKRTGVQCRAQAIRGKDKCRLHGGKTPCKHGRYSKYNPAVVELLQKSKSLKSVDGLYSELAATMGAVNDYIATLHDGKSLLVLFERVDKLVRDLVKNEMSNTDTLQHFIEHVANRLCVDERRRFMSVVVEYLSQGPSSR